VLEPVIIAMPLGNSSKRMRLQLANLPVIVTGQAAKATTCTNAVMAHQDTAHTMNNALTGIGGKRESGPRVAASGPVRATAMPTSTNVKIIPRHSVHQGCNASVVIPQQDTVQTGSAREIGPPSAGESEGGAAAVAAGACATLEKPVKPESYSVFFLLQGPCVSMNGLAMSAQRSWKRIRAVL